MEIITDDREKHVVPHFDEYKNEYNINYKVERMNVGDYAISYKNYIIVIIERKTWADLAASIRDGRKANIEKLKQLRETVGCQIAYLIEGPAMPKPNDKFARMPYKNLRSHLDHLAFRDSVHMLYSNDATTSARRIMELALNISTDKITCKEIDALILADADNNNDPNKIDDKVEINTVDKIDDKIDDNNNNKIGDKIDDKINSIDDNSNVENKTGGTVHALHDTYKSAVNVGDQLLQCIPTVGPLVSAVMVQNGVTLSGLYNGQFDIDFIANLTYATGALIGRVRAQKIINGISLLDKDTKAANKMKLNVLTSIPNVSTAAANAILAATSIPNIINGITTEYQLAALQKTAKSKVGYKAANNLITYLCISLKTSST
jgi:ERCC4-type nuclease